MAAKRKKPEKKIQRSERSRRKKDAGSDAAWPFRELPPTIDGRAKMDGTWIDATDKDYYNSAYYRQHGKTVQPFSPVRGDGIINLGSVLPPQAIERIKQEAVKKVRNGAELLVLTDRTVYDADRRYLDPHLATSAVDQALKGFKVEPGEENLRRRCGIVLRSAAIRNVHDTMLALGLGANGVCPYTMVEVVCVEDYESNVSNLCDALEKGIEKVISTIGIHEVRGYARQFSSIGVKPELAEIFLTEAFGASESGGVGFTALDVNTNERARILAGDEEAKPAKTFRFYPKVYKAAIATANGSGSYEEYSEKVRDLEQQSPISMRHIMGLKGDREPIADPSVVDAGVGLHDYPVVISSMSFGSQSEPAFRAYAEAAKSINVLCVNGEGGEIRDMYGNYRKWRGQQVASGRFGVSAEMLNSSYLAEIKIGQGAKPGEGGHLPGKKVSEKVAAARNASPGTDLISPSNNHDLYSIEDLAELIDELKTVNPDLRVSVKVPVVPNVGTIGLGIAKAGADIITLSGFEGGTGAARQHARDRRPIQQVVHQTTTNRRNAGTADERTAALVVSDPRTAGILDTLN